MGSYAAGQGCNPGKWHFSALKTNVEKFARTVPMYHLVIIRADALEQCMFVIK